MIGLAGMGDVYEIVRRKAVRPPIQQLAGCNSPGDEWAFVHNPRLPKTCYRTAVLTSSTIAFPRFHEIQTG